MDKADLEESLVQIGATRDSLQTKISDAAGSAATTEAEMEATTAFWAKERADFAQSEQERGCHRHLGEGGCNLEKEMKVETSMLHLPVSVLANFRNYSVPLRTKSKLRFRSLSKGCLCFSRLTSFLYDGLILCLVKVKLVTTFVWYFLLSNRNRRTLEFEE